MNHHFLKKKTADWSQSLQYIFYLFNSVSTINTTKKKIKSKKAKLVIFPVAPGLNHNTYVLTSIKYVWSMQNQIETVIRSIRFLNGIIANSSFCDMYTSTW